MYLPVCLLGATLALANPTQSLASGPDLTWEQLPAHLEAAEAAGFSGAALVIRDGEVVLDRGYGLADREHEIPCTPDTIFAIGSTPIDFTRAAILLLAQEGKLTLDEKLPAFFGERVPADKRQITITHLMSGASGLQDFLGLPTDRDPDHFWIDRAEAVRRILGQELLFEPGTGNEHSHAAWGLLAAIVELRSGKSYPDFTKQRLFGPAGMASTEFFGVELPDERVAVGYGFRTTGEVNKPPHWGPTSWLVMGSGGMVSTTRDMDRWFRALRAGKILSPEFLARYWSPPGAVLDGGDMWGFEILYTEGPDTYMFVVSNSVGPDTMDAFAGVAEPIAELCLTEARPPFTLGLELEFQPPQSLVVASVTPGGPAAAAGIRAGDVIVGADGSSIWPDPMAALGPALNGGATLLLELRRGEEHLTIELEPARRSE
ncbi:Putative penicillin-binding protein PbpX [Planctomycetes bacterium Pla86]|uniref:Penicillin-binding protein PbpX n=2 Tax=Engelhardtia mirabilis TaxID=2528011 RepID=A0A518BID0_9BACT|nr:Putative penicillin-binding protein PbpX [Planctomycetes bacterium Pla133]QDV01065.1 Putative penicillin-binding protein PbpX [Planctomycetes bacterium Pla86]